VVRTYDYPVWGTQGGGLAREVDGTYVFVEAPPSIPSLEIGDEVPEEWDLIPANERAKMEVL